MTYSVTVSDAAGNRRQNFKTAESAVSKIDEVRDSGASVRVNIDSDLDRPGDLTHSERLIIWKEGRTACLLKVQISESPYLGDQEHQSVWLDGYRERST